MKNVLIVLIFLLFPFSISYGIDEPLNYREAYNKAKIENKNLLIIFSRPNCLYCDILESDIKNSTNLSFVKLKYVILKKKYSLVTDMEKPLQQIHKYAKVKMVPFSIEIDIKKNEYGRRMSGYNQANWIKKFK